jgi:uncharacterized membrane protein
MPWLNQLLLLGHVLCAMYWFGASSSVPRRAREALAAERGVARALGASLGRSVAPLAIAAILTFLTGTALALLRPGGFASLPPRFHVGLLLAIVWLMVGAHGTRRSMRKLLDALAGAGPLDAVQPLGKQISVLAGIEKLLFSAVTVLMLWRL